MTRTAFTRTLHLLLGYEITIFRGHAFADVFNDSGTLGYGLRGIDSAAVLRRIAHAQRLFAMIFSAVQDYWTVLRQYTGRNANAITAEYTTAGAARRRCAQHRLRKGCSLLSCFV